jgi:hypothetical protein
MLTALFLVLLVLWLLGFLQIGNLDFLRVVVFRVGARGVTVLDTLIAIAVVWVIAALPGPLAISAGVLLILWALTIAGVVAVEGIPLNALIILVIIVGLLVHILTRRGPR